jgi:hypothetical protein
LSRLKCIDAKCVGAQTIVGVCKGCIWAKSSTPLEAVWLRRGGSNTEPPFGERMNMVGLDDEPVFVKEAEGDD